MQTANARLRLNKFGSDVPVRDMTPAEAVLLHTLHQANNGGSTFGVKQEDIEIGGDALVVTGHTPEQVIPAVEGVAARPAVGEVGKPGYVAAVAAIPAKAEQVIPSKPITRPRTDQEELRRLHHKYGRCVNKRGEKIVTLLWQGFDVKLPQTFKDINWNMAGLNDTEVAPLNYATGAPLATK